MIIFMIVCGLYGDGLLQEFRQQQACNDESKGLTQKERESSLLCWQQIIAKKTTVFSPEPI
jgi:hypothetical protein